MSFPNPAAAGVPYFTPKQPKIAGSAWPTQPSGKEVPLLFQPLKIKNLTLQNRVAVTPMCTYSAGFDGVPTPFHLVHYGAMATRGPGFIMTEAVAITPVGRTSPNDLGIWNSGQAKHFKAITDFVHSQGQIIGIQLDHSGRKGSTVANYLTIDGTADETVGGFPTEIVGPSALAYKPENPIPHELSEQEIHEIVKLFGEAAKRSVEEAGFDYVEIHAAHGYLLNQFVSAYSNRRTDNYGGSFENRIRMLLEVIDEVKANVPEHLPIFLRISASENVDDDPITWQVEDSVKLAKIVVEKGIDLIDISSGGNNPNQHRRGMKQGVHVPLAKAVKEAVGDKCLVSVVGGITDADYANELVEDGSVDIVMAGRAFLRNPGLVWTWADELGATLFQSTQYSWGFFGPRSMNPDLYT